MVNLFKPKVCMGCFSGRKHLLKTEIFTCFKALLITGCDSNFKAICSNFNSLQMKLLFITVECCNKLRNNKMLTKTLYIDLRVLLCQQITIEIKVHTFTCAL